MKFNIPKDELNQMLHVDDRSIAECADHFGCSKRTIQKRMSEYDITFWPRRYELDVPRLIEMYHSGMTLHEIADTVECDWQTVYARIRDKVDMREQKARPGVNSGPNGPRWEGGVRVTEGGYVRIRWYGKEESLHRVIMKGLGHDLKPEDHVHHMDLNPANNDPNNLLICTNSEHHKLHAALRRNPDLDQRAWLADYRKQARAA